MKLLVMCIGNQDGGDDAVGPYIADILSEKAKDNIEVLNCGIAPENYTSNVKKSNPEHLIIIDAIDMALQPGQIRIVPPEKIGRMHISSHGIPLSVLVQYLKQYIGKISIIGIQPKSMGGSLTEEIKKSSEELVSIILREDLQALKKLT
jgi:hydrogenase 3 maturation protease